MSWGFNNVAIKLAIHDIPPLIQSTARSLIAALLVGAWTRARGIPLLKHDGTLRAGILAGVLFALEFLLIYRGLVWTTATRGVLFLYLAPFFVVIGSRWLVPGDHFHLSQWLGLLLSFVGIVIVFGLPTPAAGRPVIAWRTIVRRRRGRLLARGSSQQTKPKSSGRRARFSSTTSTMFPKECGSFTVLMEFHRQSARAVSRAN